jgi:protein TonB
MWVQRPSADDLSRHFPDAAVKAGVAGRVAMSCRALVTGALTACSVLSESPAGYGFGEAALRLSPLFRLASRMSDGASVEGITLRLPIVFRMAEPPPPQ